jgi:aminopeptidase N
MPAGLVAALLAMLLITGSALAARHGRPRLVVAHVTSPAKADAGESFEVDANVRNVGRRAFVPSKGGRLRVSLRGEGAAQPIGQRGLRRILPGERRRLPIRVRVPVALAPTGTALTNGPFHLAACVRSQGSGGKRRCNVAKRKLLIGVKPGAPSLGDPLFPQIGNGGYDALHYAIDLDYDPATNSFAKGTATTITALATQDLAELSFDFQDDLAVSAVTVDGAGAAFEQVAAKPRLSNDPAVTQPGKLIVTSPRRIPAGRHFHVQIAYAGTPVPITDADESIEGWVRACQVPEAQGGCDGSFTVNEPIGAQSWFPSNDYPADKATFETKVTVPGTHVALGTGELASRTVNSDGTVTWDWTEDDRTATYLTSATVGEFDYDDSASFTETSTGTTLPVYTAIDSAKLPVAKSSFETNVAEIPAMINFLADHYGAYPFDSVGAVSDIAPDVGYSLENQTKPHFAGTVATSPLNESVLVHELSHQWMGDSVSPATWEEIWFNEGWATFSEQLFADPGDGSVLEGFFDDVYATPDDGGGSEWRTPPAHVGGPANLFAKFPVYERPGAMLEGLREIFGDDAFYEFARNLQARYGHDEIGINQFVATAVDASGLTGARRRLLEDYLQQWLYGSSKPGLTPDDFPAAASAPGAAPSAPLSLDGR